MSFVGLAAEGLTPAAAFFFGFPVASLGAAVGLASGFSGLAVNNCGSEYCGIYRKIFGSNLA